VRGTDTPWPGGAAQEASPQGKVSPQSQVQLLREVGQLKLLTVGSPQSGTDESVAQAASGADADNPDVA